MLKTSLFAVVVDYFEAVKDAIKDRSYMTVKVIDDTLNKKESLKWDKKTISFAYISFTNELGENLPKVVNVGDIIRIRRFSFHFGKLD